MRSPAIHLVLLIIVGFALSGCASTMYVKTEGDSSVALDKRALHYIFPPPPTDSLQAVNLYPLVVRAFRQNHIALTENREEAAYLVTWGTQDKTTQINTALALPTNPAPMGNGYNGGPSSFGTGLGSGTFNQTTPGTNSVPYTVTQNMKNFTISIWSNKNSGSQLPVMAWRGGASAQSEDVKDPAVIINDIVARYGTNFKGDAEITTATP